MRSGNSGSHGRGSTGVGKHEDVSRRARAVLVDREVWTKEFLAAVVFGDVLALDLLHVLDKKDGFSGCVGSRGRG
jgi:hypothetical protein